MTLQPCARCKTPTPAYYLTQGLCDDCKWLTWIPEGYADREAYEHDPVWGHENATLRPPMGVDFLDQRARMVSDVMPMCRKTPRGWSWAPGSTAETRH